MFDGVRGENSPGRIWTRREVVRTAALVGAHVLVAGVGNRLRAAAEARRVGLIVPGAGPLRAAGEAVATGAAFGAQEVAHTAQLLGHDFELVQREAEDPDAARRAARALVEEHGIFAVAGGLDEWTAIALSEVADELGILYLNVGSGADVLRGESCRATTFNVGASTAMIVDALADWFIGERGLSTWAFVVPDSPSGEAIYRRALRALEEAGGREVGRFPLPENAMDFRRTIDALERARPAVAFVALEGDPLLAFLERYREAGASFEITGPAFDLARHRAVGTPAPAGTWPVVWHHSLERFGASQLNDRFRDHAGRPMDSLGWTGWMAMKVLWEATLRARTTDAGALARLLVSDRMQFDGHKGVRLSFRPWDHQLRQPLYLVRARDADPPEDGFEVVAEVPRARPGEPESSRDRLDRLGHAESEGGCRLPTA